MGSCAELLIRSLGRSNGMAVWHDHHAWFFGARPASRCVVRHIVLWALMCRKHRRKGSKLRTLDSQRLVDAFAYHRQCMRACTSRAGWG
jgi:hypothetical protein